MKVTCFAFVMNRSHESIGHWPISYLGNMYRDLSSLFFLFSLLFSLLLCSHFPKPLPSTQPTYTANHVDCILQPSPTLLSSNPQPSYTSFQSYRTTYLWKVIPYRIEISVILFDVESLLDLHVPPMAPTTQSTLDILSKSMGIKGQLRHLQRNFGIGHKTGQPNHQLYALVTLQAIEIVLSASQQLLMYDSWYHISSNTNSDLRFLHLRNPHCIHHGWKEVPNGQVALLLLTTTFDAGDLLYNIWFIQRCNGVLCPTLNIQNNSCYYAVNDGFAIFSSMEASPDSYKRAQTCYNNILKQTRTDPKCAKMFNQLRSEGTLLFDLSIIEKNYIAPGPFIRSILPLVDSWFVQEIRSASAKLPRAAGTPTSAPTYVKPMYIVSEGVTEKAEVRGPASVVLSTVHQTPDKRTTCSGAATSKIKVSYYGYI